MRRSGADGAAGARPTWAVLVVVAGAAAGAAAAACPPYKWRCVSRPEVCVDRFSYQDGIRDCPDGSDEECLPWQFDCRSFDAESPRCIDIAKRQNGAVDCSDGRDELASACDSAPCLSGGRCVAGAQDPAADYLCLCRRGYSGDRCHIRVQAGCASAPCRNLGTCIALTGTGSSRPYTCACRAGYTGINCQTALPAEPCASNPCRNGGTCIATTRRYLCRCTDAYRGTTCQIENA